MKTNNFSDIDIDAIRQWRSKRKTNIYRKKIQAIDTETLQDGTVYLFASNNGSFWRPEGKELLEHLGSHRYRYTANYFYNMDFDFSVMIKLILNDIFEKKDTVKSYMDKLGKGISVEVERYAIEHIPGKMFRIADLSLKNKRWCSFFDLAQFYNYESLNDASKEYLAQEKFDVEVEIEDIEQAEDNREKLIEYCIQDCRLTAKLARYMATMFEEINIDFYRSPYSKAYLAQDYVLQNGEVHRIEWRDSLEKDIQECYYKAYAGGRFEVFKRGHFDKVYEYDINSAYPYVMANLPDFNYGRWLDYQPGDEQPGSEFKYGIVYAHIETGDNHIQPLWSRDNRGRITFPELDEDRYITLEEIQFFIEHDMIENLEIEWGQVWEPIGKEKLRLHDMMHELYDYRKELKKVDNDLQLVVKIIMNSIYGKMIQIIKKYIEVEDEEEYCDFSVLDMERKKEDAYKIDYKPGMFFNPRWAALITANTRLQILDFIFKHDLQENLIAIHTDSIIVDKPIEDTTEINDKLGGWDLEIEGEAVVLGSGSYAIKDDEKIISHWRGFTGVEYDLSDMPEERYDLFHLLEDNKDKAKIQYAKVRPWKLRESVFLDKIEKIGQFEEFNKACDINFDTKRIWEEDFENCNDVLTRCINSSSLTI